MPEPHSQASHLVTEADVRCSLQLTRAPWHQRMNMQGISLLLNGWRDRPSYIARNTRAAGQAADRRHGARVGFAALDRAST